MNPCVVQYVILNLVLLWQEKEIPGYFVYTTSVALPKGTKLKFDLQTKGRDIDWEVPTSNLKKTSNVIFGHLDNGKILQAKEIQVL